MLNEFFYRGTKNIFVECGRKWGKTEIIIYILYREAMTHPNAAYYYIAPFAKQARELIWETKRLQNFLNFDDRKKYIHRVYEGSMRIRFKNGSFIKLDGADNYDAYRGINPHGIIYEEAKDHHPGFHEAMEPNLATYNAFLIVIGTPPESEDNLFCKLAEEFKRESDSAYFNQPTWFNPHISVDWLKKMKRKLFVRGDYDIWYREYCAKRVKNLRRHLFPMLESGVWHNDELITEGKHFKFHDTVMTELASIKPRNLKWFCTADPASSSVFGILFSVVDEYTKKVYHLDEIYADDQREMSVKKMWEKCKPIIKEFNQYIDEWNLTYDEAATWWYNEMMNEFKIFWTPTQKAQTKKMDGLSLIKDQLNSGQWVASSRCRSLRFEMENYIKDKNNKIPKHNDHLIDGMRYTNKAAYLDTKEEEEPPEPDKDDLPRRHTLDEVYTKKQNMDNWEESLVGDL